MKPITRKQLFVYDALARFLKRSSYSPSVSELCQLTGLKSKSTVALHLNQLRSKGYVTWEEKRPRTLKIIKDVSLEDRERLKRKYEFVI